MRALVNAIPALRAGLPPSLTLPPTGRRPRPERPAGLSRSQDPQLRAAVERWAVERAVAHYRNLGATKVLELGKPYDLSVHGLGPVRHVEVKRSSSNAVA